MQINRFMDIHNSAKSQSSPQSGSRFGSPGVDGSSGQLTFAASTDGVQLSRLGAVLNSLETGAMKGQRHIEKVTTQVRAGSYLVDAAKLSNRIVSDALSRT